MAVTAPFNLKKWIDDNRGLLKPPVGNQCIGYNKIDKELLEEYTVIINCTPLGMYPNEDAMPELPYQNLSSQHYLYDLIYRPAETKFLQQGKQRGATIKNGYEMLLIQAEENWRIWNRQ